MKLSVLCKPILRASLLCTAFSGIAIIGGLVGSVATSTVAHAAPIPEPASLLVLGLGVAGLMAVRRQAR